jgi:hypothetical protein
MHRIKSNLKIMATLFAILGLAGSAISSARAQSGAPLSTKKHGQVRHASITYTNFRISSYKTNVLKYSITLANPSAKSIKYEIKLFQTNAQGKHIQAIALTNHGKPLLSDLFPPTAESSHTATADLSNGKFFSLQITTGPSAKDVHEFRLEKVAPGQVEMFRAANTPVVDTFAKGGGILVARGMAAHTPVIETTSAAPLPIRVARTQPVRTMRRTGSEKTTASALPPTTYVQGKNHDSDKGIDIPQGAPFYLIALTSGKVDEVDGSRDVNLMLYRVVRDSSGKITDYADGTPIAAESLDGDQIRHRLPRSTNHFYYPTNDLTNTTDPQFALKQGQEYAIGVVRPNLGHKMHYAHFVVGL